MTDTVIETITIEGIEFPIKPTPVAKLAPLLVSLRDANSASHYSAVQEAVFWGIRRAGNAAGGDGPGKGITLEWLIDNVDFLNIDYVREVFVRVNKLSVGEAVSATVEHAQ